VTATGDALALAAELGKVAANIERELLRRCDRQDARLLEMSDKLTAAEKTIARLDRRLKAAERRARAAATAPAPPVAVRSVA
jgi:hypothetical protein